MSEATGVIRLDDAAIPVATTIVGLEVTGMQSGQVTKVPVSLLKGNKGDPGTALTYADLTPAQIAELQQPATDMIADVNLAISNAETATQAANDAAAQAQIDVSALTADMAQVQTDLAQLEADVSLKMPNLITNGNFVSGTAGWLFGTNISGVSVLDGVLTFTGGGSLSITSNNWLNQNNQQPENNILFCAASAKSEQAGTFYIGAGYAGTGYALTTSFIRYSYRGDNVNNNKFVMGANAGNIVQVKNAINMNLTAIFGAGNEPTNEEMDTLMNILGIEYFDGEITLTQKQVMNWELKLIRQNRNAIVALGGTII